MIPLVRFPELVEHYVFNDNYAPFFVDVFSAEAFIEFKRYISGLLISENKTVEGLGHSLVEVGDKVTPLLAQVHRGGKTPAFEKLVPENTEPDFDLVKPRDVHWGVDKANAMGEIFEKGLASGHRPENADFTLVWPRTPCSSHVCATQRTKEADLWVFNWLTMKIYWLVGSSSTVARMWLRKLASVRVGLLVGARSLPKDTTCCGARTRTRTAQRTSLASARENTCVTGFACQFSRR